MRYLVHATRCVTVCLGAAIALAPAQGQQNLSLADAVSRALGRNPDLAADAPATEAARAEYEAVRAGYFPRIDFEQAYTGGNNPVYVFGTLLTQRRFTADNFALDALNRPDPMDNLQSRFSARQMIWDGGRTRHAREAAELMVVLADRGHEANRRRVMLEVIDAYFAVSLAQEGKDAAAAALQSAEAIVLKARARVESGLAVQADLLRGQVYLAAARQNEIEAAGNLEMARARLNRLMGDPLDALFGMTAALSPAPLPVPDEDALLAQQKANRPDYQGAAAEVRQAEVEAESRRREFYPVIGAFAAWEADNPSLKEAGGQNWAAGISLQWNLYSGGRDASRLEASRQRLEQSRRRLVALESALALELRQARVRLRASEQQVEAARAGEAQSSESLRILQNRYDAGLATMTDVLSAEAERATARTSLAEAAYRHRISYAQLEFAAGTLSPTSKSIIP